MLRFLQFAALLTALALPAASRCQQTDPGQQKQSVHGSQGGQSVPPAGPDTPAQDKTTVAIAGAPDAPPNPPPDSVAAAARKARGQKKETSRPPRVFTNDNLPTAGGLSTVGAASSASSSDAGPDKTDKTGETGKTPGGAFGPGNSERVWRDRFAKLNHKLESDKQDLDVMQRELGVLDVQYYNDPVKAMQEQLTRDDINKKSADIDAKKKQIEADQQAIDDAQDELRRAGGDPGWAR
jgi:hypothetical protein